MDLVCFIHLWMDRVLCNPGWLQQFFKSRFSKFHPLSFGPDSQSKKGGGKWGQKNNSRWDGSKGRRRVFPTCVGSSSPEPLSLGLPWPPFTPLSTRWRSEMLEPPWQVSPSVLQEGECLRLLHKREDVLCEAQVPAEAKAVDVLSTLKTGECSSQSCPRLSSSVLVLSQ